jgi:hypothetical protein
MENKPFYKKWWFWIFIVIPSSLFVAFIAFVLIGLSMLGSFVQEVENPNKPAITQETKESKEKKIKEQEENEKLKQVNAKTIKCSVGYFDVVDYGAYITNNTDKTIKYVTLSVKFFNAVGDQVYGDLSFSEEDIEAEMTGPLNSGESKKSYWGLMGNSQVKSCDSEVTNVEFMDGTIWSKN